MPISVAVDDLPATVRQGSVVDVWVAPKVGAVERAAAHRGAGARPTSWWSPSRVRSNSLAPESTRQVIVGVPAERADELGTALGGISDGRVVIARKG